jgi:pimeloyl-ACP methyl ester carboxylesterase
MAAKGFGDCDANIVHRQRLGSDATPTRLINSLADYLFSAHLSSQDEGDRFTVENPANGDAGYHVLTYDLRNHGLSEGLSEESARAT